MTLRTAGLDPCTHCGFCLQSCPTFLVTGDEADGPRGRIELMRELTAGRLLATDDKLGFHLDRCLGCRACETVCPPGVEYGAALEEVRAEVLNARVPRLARLVNYVMADTGVQRVAFAGSRAARPFARFFSGGSRLGFAWGMLAATRPNGGTHRHGGVDAPVSQNAPHVAFFTGCIMSGLFDHVHEATVRVLRANGVVVHGVEGQRCCGALHAHSGQHDDAVELARTNIRAFMAMPDDIQIVVNSAGCGALLKEYARLLEGDPLEDDARAFAERVRDVSEVLSQTGVQLGHPLQLRVAYDPPCHLQHAQRVVDPPLEMLHAIPGVEILTHRESDLCCGSAGSYSLSEPGLSRAVLDRKVEALLAAQPDVVVTGNPGCIMQIGAGLRATGSDIPVVHPVELLDRSYRSATTPGKKA
jgi:glycolate dehydrogenase iron-sulfur subunit